MPEKTNYYPLDFEYGKLVREISTPVTLYSEFSTAEGKIVNTSAVWDTGANHSVLSPKIVGELSLRSIDSAPVHGIANTSRESDIVVASIRITDDLVLTNRRFSVIDIPGTEVLIGMDIIKLGNFVINNSRGKTLFSFVIPPLEERISYSEIVKNSFQY